MTNRYRSAARLFSFIVICLLLLWGCSDSSNNSNNGSQPEYKAEIIWTEYGIPHVVADDWEGLGYGIGNAFAQQNFCPYMRDVVRANGQSAELLGDEGNLAFDFVMKLYNTDEALERVKAQMSPRGLALFKGYAAGISRYLEDTGVDNLAEGAYVIKCQFQSKRALRYIRLQLFPSTFR